MPCRDGSAIIEGGEGHEAFMREALGQARLAYAKGEVPVGAVAVRDGRVIGRGHNRKEELGDATAHAEMLALREATETLGGWRLQGVSLYSTKEPCTMCAGALVQGRVERLIFAVPDPKGGAAGSIFDLVRSRELNHRLEVIQGVLEEEARELLRSFFEGLREEMRGGIA